MDGPPAGALRGDLDGSGGRAVTFIELAGRNAKATYDACLTNGELLIRHPEDSGAHGGIGIAGYRVSDIAFSLSGEIGDDCDPVICIDYRPTTAGRRHEADLSGSSPKTMIAIGR